jgi:hypothetical protein
MEGKGKAKVHPRTCHEVPEGKQRYSSTLSLTLVLDCGGWLTPRSGRITPRGRHDTHRIGGWLGPKAGLDRCGKSRSPQEFDPRIVHPVASRYTNCGVQSIRRAVSWLTSAFVHSDRIEAELRPGNLNSVILTKKIYNIYNPTWYTVFILLNYAQY